MHQNLQLVLDAALKLDPQSQVVLAEQILAHFAADEPEFSAKLAEAEKRREQSLHGTVGAFTSIQNLRASLRR